MEINRISSLQFKSRINFVSPKCYESIVKSMSENKGYHNIYEWFIKTGAESNLESNAYRKNVSQISTEEIRSCIAGFFVDAKRKITNLAFHLYDDRRNIEKLEILNEQVEGTNGLLIGARRVYRDSIPIFENFEREAENKNIPMTIFKDFRGTWEANIAYDACGDEYYLCVKDIQNPKVYVNNKYILESAFNKISLSPTDTVEYLK